MMFLLFFPLFHSVVSHVHERSTGIDVMSTRGVGFGGFGGLMAPITKSLLLVAFLGVIGSGTILDCTDANNLATPNITVTAAGDYDVTCVGPSTWFLFIAGCGNVGSTATGTVNLRLLSSPTQVLVSDNSSLLQMVSSGGSGPLSLRDCRVNITYVANTAVPVVGATSARAAHVVVHTASLAAVVVSVFATMHLEGMFMAIVGNGTGSIDLVDITFPSGSTIACRNAYPACSATLGTTILGLGLGCPIIGKVRVELNGTNTSASMVPIYPTASFALIAIDHSTGNSTTPTPNDHELIIDRVSALWAQWSLVVLLQFVDPSVLARPYPFYNGTILVRGSSLTLGSGASTSGTLFEFDNPLVTQLMFDGVESGTGLLTIFHGLYQRSVVCGSVQIRFDNCAITSTISSPIDVRLPVLDCAIVLVVQAHNTTFTPRNQWPVVRVSNPPSLLIAVSIMLLIRACNVVLHDTSSQLLALVTNTTAVNSTIQLVDTMIVQEWTPFLMGYFNSSSSTVYYTEIAPVSLIELGSAHNATFEVISCNFTVVQKSTTTKFLQSPAALLLSVTGRVADALITIRNSTFVTVRNISIGSSVELHASLLNLSASSLLIKTAVVLQKSTFVNIESIVWLPTHETTDDITLDNSMTMIDGCKNFWCPHSESNSSGIVSGGMLMVGCTRNLFAVAMVNLPAPLPARISVLRCATDSGSRTSIETATLFLPISLSQNAQQTPTHLTSSASLTIQQPPTPLSSALIAASRGLTAIVTVTYMIPRATSGAALAFAQVSLRSLTVARLCNDNSNDDNDDDPFLSSPMDNPLQLHFTGSGIPSAARFVAGSVVGNVVVCMICCVIGVLIVAIARHHNKQSVFTRNEKKVHQSTGATPSSFFSSLFECLPHLPSSLAFPYGALSQPLATASAALFVVAGTNDGDVGETAGVGLLALVGLSVCVVLPIHWVAVVHFNWFRKVTEAASTDRDSCLSAQVEQPVRFVLRLEAPRVNMEASPFVESLLLRLHTFMLYPHAFDRWDLHPQYVSPSAQDRYRRPVAVEAYLPLMEAYRPSRQWYFAVDASYSVVCGALSGIAWAVNTNFDSNSDATLPAASQSADGCDWVVWVTLALTLLVICILCILRPFLAYYELSFALMMATLTAITLAFQLAGKEAASDTIATIQIVVGLLMPAMQLLRLVMLWSFVLLQEGSMTVADIVKAIAHISVGKIGGLVDRSSSLHVLIGRKKKPFSKTSDDTHRDDTEVAAATNGVDNRLLTQVQLELLVKLICRRMQHIPLHLATIDQRRD